MAEDWVFLNHAGVAPLPRSSARAVEDYLESAVRLGSVAGKERLARVEDVRARAARFLAVPVDDVAFVKNTTEGIGFVASGLEWAEGDRVVVPDLEFPSAIYPWLALADRGVVVDRVTPLGPGRALPMELFEERLAQGPVKVVALSWVQFGRGWRTDLAALGHLCREHGALLCVDAIQGLGVLPVDLVGWGVDFAMADGHKWLLGPEGVGLLYVAGHRQLLLRPLEPGWGSVAHREQWDNLELAFHESARRLEGGTPNVGGIYGLGASVDLLAEAGIEAIWSHVDGLCVRAEEGLAGAGAVVLTDRGGQGRSGILTFELPGQAPASVCSALLERHIVCSPRGGGIRVSPHAYCTDDDVDALVEEVATLRR